MKRNTLTAAGKPKRGAMICFCLTLTMAVFLFFTVENPGRAHSQSPAPPAARERILHVYGPGGPLGPIKECGDRFARAKGVKVLVVAGPEGEWIAQAKTDADLVFGGAEYMLTQFDQKHPGFLARGSRTQLYPRAAGILVRKGNPKKIRGLSDLTRAGIRLVDVTGAGQLGLWEDMAGRSGLIGGIQKNIAVSVPTSAEAIAKLKTMPELDAWITFESWHYRLKDSMDLVQLPERERLYRGTPIAVTANTQNRQMAHEFLTFLRSEAAHQIFRKWGWK